MRWSIRLTLLPVIVVLLGVLLVQPASAQFIPTNPAGCTARADNPHRSTHDPTRVNAIVSFNCANPVPGQYIAGSLWRKRWWGWQKVAQDSNYWSDPRDYGKLSLNFNCPGGSFNYYVIGFTKYVQAGTPYYSSVTSPSVRVTC